MRGLTRGEGTGGEGRVREYGVPYLSVEILVDEHLDELALSSPWGWRHGHGRAACVWGGAGQRRMRKGRLE